MEKDFEPSLAINYILTILKYQTGMHSPVFYSYDKMSKASSVLCILKVFFG